MPRYIEPLFRPPSEARSLIFQITIGCSQNSCRFCGMYKGKKFRIRPLADILMEISEIPPLYRAGIDRVFLADGDALVYPYDELCMILEALSAAFPGLTRVASYASPGSINTKTADELAALRSRKLKILYFGLESGDEITLQAVNKGFTAARMADMALMARSSGMKLSVTAILGLAGRDRSLHHARATAAWVNLVNPEYFSLLTLFQRHNDDFVSSLRQCSRRELMLEAKEMLIALHPQKTILRSNHVSNFLTLSGNYPRDRERLIADVDSALNSASANAVFLDEIPSYHEEYY